MRRAAIITGFLSLLALIAKPIWQGREQWHWGQGQDDGLYWVLAKSLAHGTGYRVLSLPGQPYGVKYPPLYPLYLSIAWRLQPSFPQNLSVAAALQAMLVPVYIVMLLVVFRQFGLSWRRTFLLAAMTIVTLQFVLLSMMLFSELLFGCLLLAAIVAVERSVRDQGSGGRWWALLGGLLTGLAYLTRSAALPLLVAVPIFLFIRKRLSSAAYFFAPALPLVISWHYWTLTHIPPNPDPVNMTYLQAYVRILQARGGFWSSLPDQTVALSAAAAESFISGVNGLLNGLPIQHLVLAAAIAGGYRWRRRRQWPLFLIFTAFYMALLVVWMFDGLTRFLIPVLPVLFAAIAEEASHFASLCEHSIAQSTWTPEFKRLLKQAPRWTLVAIGILIMARNDRATWVRISSILGEERQLRVNDREAYSWIKQHAASEDVVLAWKDSVTYCFTGVPASRSLFVATMPQQEQRKAFDAGSFSSLPDGYRRALLLLLQSDLGTEFVDRRLDWLRGGAESIPGANLEFASPAALIYSFPVKK